MAKSTINITDREYGAVSGEDSTDAIERAVNEFSSRNNKTRGFFIIPSGEYLVSRTLDFDRVCGSKIQGSGSWRLTRRNGLSFAVNDSRLTWIGEDGGTLIRYAGSECTFGGLSLDGNHRASVIWHNCHGDGIGSGKTELSNIAIFNADNGIWCGENEEDGNIDYLCYRRMFFRNLLVAYRVINRHSIGHCFLGTTYLTQIKKAFRFAGGGDFILDHAMLTRVACYLSMVGMSHNVGINTGTFRSGYLHWDNHQYDQTPRVVEMDDFEGGGSRRITFDAVRMSRQKQLDDDVPLFRVGGDCFLHVRGFDDLRTDRLWLAAGGTPKKQPRIKIENCAINNSGPPVIPEIDKHVQLATNDCWDANTGRLIGSNGQRWTQ